MNVKRNRVRRHGVDEKNGIDWQRRNSDVKRKRKSVGELNNKGWRGRRKFDVKRKRIGELNNRG